MQADWYPDPTGRHGRRYHDGARWTEHVVDDGAVSADVDGRAMLTTPATPGAFAPPPARSWRQPPLDIPEPDGVKTRGEFWTNLGDAPRQRPPGRLTGVLAGFGGAFAGGAVIALFADSVDSGGVLVVLGMLVVGLGLAARLTPALAVHDFVSDAGTGAGILGVIAFGTGAAASAGDTAGLRVSQLLVAIAFFGLWALPGYKERPSFFGLGVASTVTFAASLFLDTSDEYGYENDPFDEYLGGVGDFVTRSGFVYLVLGLILLALVVVADERASSGSAPASQSTRS